jgi:hypothetical protein
MRRCIALSWLPLRHFRTVTRTPYSYDDKGNISREWTKLFQEWFKKVGTALDDQGNLISEILASTKIQGRSEGIGTTVSKLTNVGQLTNADQVAADG